MNKILKSSFKWFIFGIFFGVFSLFFGFMDSRNFFLSSIIWHLNFLGPKIIPGGFGQIVYLFNMPISAGIDFFVMSSISDVVFIKFREKIPSKKYLLIKILFIAFLVFIFAGIPSIIDFIKAKQIENFQSKIASNDPYNIDCHKVLNSKDRDLCYSYLRACEKIKDNFEKQNCQRQKYEEDRMGITLMKKCVILDNYEDIKNCYLKIMKMPNIANYNKTGEVCFGAVTQTMDDKNACFTALAMAIKDNKFCKNVQPYRQEDCYDELSR